MTASHEPHSAHELEDLLRARRGRIRLCGSGSRQDRLPPPGDAAVVRLARLDAIHRLEPGDLTCSVGAGLRRDVLDEALHRVGLELPCAGGGTIGGLFAHDAVGASTAGGAQPRSLLLGLEGMLANGTRFRAGAQVVKSVAGFDVHKLLVGSNGRLFVAVQMHLRLRPRPRAEAWFRRDGLEAAAACAQFAALRALAVPPAELHLQRTGSQCVVAGRFAGRASFVAERLRRLALPEAEPWRTLHLEPDGSGEVLAGIVLPSRVPELLAALPALPFLLRGGGRFELATASPAASDAALGALAALGAHACVARGEPARRGRGTTLDPGAERLLAGLKRALDPDDTFV
ncbi:MAG: FAD-binding oxidoreductase [Planctomycetes bacterium]|nr:FAD-binding oxidoreductase [Planctomycetota bacterium]